MHYLLRQVCLSASVSSKSILDSKNKVGNGRRTQQTWQSEERRTKKKRTARDQECEFRDRERQTLLISKQEGNNDGSRPVVFSAYPPFRQLICLRQLLIS
mmetsp:Transcript_40775/g.80349  ORF Transcript_40775/g.80349 Transcript_40775/m.80349 type:complete len:100 (+) Transcript_40775:1991-2290(+)